MRASIIITKQYHERTNFRLRVFILCNRFSCMKDTQKRADDENQDNNYNRNNYFAFHTVAIAPRVPSIQLNCLPKFFGIELFHFAAS